MSMKITTISTHFTSLTYFYFKCYCLLCVQIRNIGFASYTCFSCIAVIRILSRYLLTQFNHSHHTHTCIFYYESSIPQISFKLFKASHLCLILLRLFLYHYLQIFLRLSYHLLLYLSVHLSLHLFRCLSFISHLHILKVSCSSLPYNPISSP